MVAKVCPAGHASSTSTRLPDPTSQRPSGTSRDRGEVTDSKKTSQFRICPSSKAGGVATRAESTPGSACRARRTSSLLASTLSREDSCPFQTKANSPPMLELLGAKSITRWCWNRSQARISADMPVAKFFVSTASGGRSPASLLKVTANSTTEVDKFLSSTETDPIMGSASSSTSIAAALRP